MCMAFDGKAWIVQGYPGFFRCIWLLMVKSVLFKEIQEVFRCDGSYLFRELQNIFRCVWPLMVKP